MDFLLECIGFPPGTSQEELIQLVLEHGEGVPWRGDPAYHRRLPVGEGLELRLDREPEQEFWTLLPHYQVPQRLRVRVDSIARVPDSPYDALLIGWAAPPTPEEAAEGLGRQPGAYPLAAWLTDAKRLPRDYSAGGVLAVSLAGFAVHVERTFPNAELRSREILELESGFRMRPLGLEADEPGGCVELSARVKEVRHLHNRWSGEVVHLLVVDAPERPLALFVSPWQLAVDELRLPRPGWRIEGAFQLSGRVAGGLPPPLQGPGTAFG